MRPVSSDSAFARAFLLLFVGVTGVLIFVSVLLDVTGVYGTGLVPPVERTGRDDKAVRYERLSASPQALIVGGSEANCLLASKLQELTGLRSFNFSVDALATEDLEAIRRFVTDHHHEDLKLVVLPMAPEVLHTHRFQRSRGGFSRHLRPYIDPYGLARLNLDTVLGAETMNSNFKSLHRYFVEGQTKVVDFLDEVGDDTRPDPTPHTEAELSARIDDGVDLIRGLYVDFQKLAPERVKDLRHTLQGFRQQGIAVDIYLASVHPRARDALQSTKYPARLAETDVLLAGLQREGLIRRYFNFSDIKAYGGDPGAFKDPWHQLHVNGARILTAMYGK